MSDKGNIYWASFRAACYAAVILFLAAKIDGCVMRHYVKSHNCTVKWAEAAKTLAETYQTNVVVRKIRTDEHHEHYDVNNTKLLLYKEADMKFGPGAYILEMKEYEPCQKHYGPMRIYYTVKPKKKED